MSNGFSYFDSVILFAYLIVVLSLGFYYSRRQDKNLTDYFLGGRNMGWIVVGLSIFATNISSEHFIGLAGSGAARGLAVGQFELMAIFILILLGWFIAPIYIKSNVLTLPEFLEKRFDRRSRNFFTTLSIIIYVFTKISVTLFAGGILFYKIFGLNVYTSAIIIVLFTGLYTVLGGAMAVMKTHVFQAVMLISGAVLSTLFGLHEVGGFAGLQSKLPADFFNMFKTASDPDYPWTGIIFGAPIIAFWYWCTDQYIVQRLLSAKSINDARRGSLLAAFLKILPLFILVLPGLIAVALYPEINGDDAYPVLLASNILPSGIKGLVVAGLLAAIMSSLSSVFSSTAALFTNDYYKPAHPEATDSKLLLIGRLSTTAVVVLTIICVPLVKVITSQVYIYMQNLQALVAPPVTAVFVFGLLNKRINSKAAIWTFIFGEFLGFLRLVLIMAVNSGFIHNETLVFLAKMNFLHSAVILFAISSITLFLISYLTASEESAEEGKIGYFFADSIKEIGGSFTSSGTIRGYRTNLIMSAFILLIIFGLWSLW